MDNEIQELRRNEEWQRLYAALNRAGREPEAQKLFLDHPINVECTIQYQYHIHWGTPDWMSDHRNHIMQYTFNEALEEFIEAKVGAAQILSISRDPVYRVLNSQINTSYLVRGPLESISLTVEQVEDFKARVRSHPDYMRAASADQIAAASQADDRDAINAQRRIKAERDKAERERIRQETTNSFEEEARELKKEAWRLWIENFSLSRAEFAAAIEGFSVKFILFKLKDSFDGLGHLDLDSEALATHQDLVALFGRLWYQSYDKRFASWKRREAVLSS